MLGFGLLMWKYSYFIFMLGWRVLFHLKFFPGNSVASGPEPSFTILYFYGNISSRVNGLGELFRLSIAVQTETRSRSYFICMRRSGANAQSIAVQKET